MTPHRLLVGPVDAAWAKRFLHENNKSVQWFPFAARDWTAVAASFPAGWLPDAVLLPIAYASVPSWVWSCPLPIVALAQDPNLLWHVYREQLPLFDLVLTDAPAAERFTRAGLKRVHAAHLYGLDNNWFGESERPEVERNIDVLFVGNLNSAVQSERLPWLGRLARLADRYKIVIRSGVFGAEYRNLVRRSKIVFNRSIRGECNMRVFEATVGGAVLFQEEGNAEVPHYLRPDEYVRYSDADLEEQLAHFLQHDDERRAIAARASARVKATAWLDLVRTGLTNCADQWPAIVERAAGRAGDPPRPSLAARLWQRVSLAVGPDADSQLANDLRVAGDDHGRALIGGIAAEALEHLARAIATGNRVSAVGLGSALASLNRKDEAIARVA